MRMDANNCELMRKGANFAKGMTDKEIEILLSEGEGLNVEFKSSFNNEVIETLVAFTNTSGGSVLIGVTNDGLLSGVSINSETIQNWLNEIKNKTSPSLIPYVESSNFMGKVIVVFTIQEYPIKPVATRGKYFKRIANSNHVMSLDEIANEHLRTINSSWDYYTDPGHSIETISIEKVQRFIQKVEQQKQKKIENEPLEFLKKLEIIRNDQITFGGFLLFVKEYCLISDVEVGRFKSDTIIIDSLSLNTDLFTEIDEILNFIKRHLMVEYIITGEAQRTERFDYPVDAIREIVINMVVHRDYRDSSGSNIKIFDDRIEFFNPGKLYGGITVQDLLSGNYTSQCRNKLIANACKEAGLIERYGSGIQRILNICKNYDVVPPTFEEIYNGFRVILYKEKRRDVVDVPKDVPKDVLKDVPKDVPKEERIEFILSLINENDRITLSELAQKCKVNIKTIKRDIVFLRAEDRLKRAGGRKEGRWIIIRS